MLCLENKDLKHQLEMAQRQQQKLVANAMQQLEGQQADLTRQMANDLEKIMQKHQSEMQELQTKLQEREEALSEMSVELERTQKMNREYEEEIAKLRKEKEEWGREGKDLIGLSVLHPLFRTCLCHHYRSRDLLRCFHVVLHPFEGSVEVLHNPCDGSYRAKYEYSGAGENRRKTTLPWILLLGCNHDCEFSNATRARPDLIGMERSKTSKSQSVSLEFL